MASIGIDIELAKSYLEQGELIGFPTETVYGLAGNALNADAVAKIFEVKNRPSFDPLILHTSSLERVAEFTSDFPEKLMRLGEKFWPGPLTLLLPKKPNIPDLVTSGLNTVAVRVPNHPMASQLLHLLNFPLAAPSANPFGYISPTNPYHVNAQLGDKIPFILDGGNCDVGLESTIIGLEDGKVTVYRLGGLDLSAIEAVVGEVAILMHSSSNPKSPGMLKSHYAPTKNFVLGNLPEMIKEYEERNESFAILSFSNKFESVPESLQIQLSLTRNLAEAAKNLFASMRTLDSLNVSVILSELLPEIGLGRAVNDRLRRAAATEKYE